MLETDNKKKKHGNGQILYENKGNECQAFRNTKCSPHILPNHVEIK